MYRSGVAQPDTQQELWDQLRPGRWTFSQQTRGKKDAKDVLLPLGFKLLDESTPYASYTFLPPERWYVRQDDKYSPVEIINAEGKPMFYVDMGQVSRIPVLCENEPFKRGSYYSSSTRSYRREVSVSPRVWMVALLAFILLLGALWGKTYQIQDDEAVARFVELSDGAEVEIVRRSNNSVIVGSPGDVSYELLIDGQPASGRCTDSFISPLICRIYPAGGGDD